MGLRSGTPKLFGSLILSLALALGCAQHSFAAGPSGLRAALTAAGFQDAEIQPSFLKRIDRSYSKEYVSDHINWLRKQGLMWHRELLKVLPIVLPLPIEEDLEKKTAWLKSEGVQDIRKLMNSQPEFLGLSLEKDLKKKTAWFKSQGVKDVSQLISDFPEALVLPLEEDLKPRIAWLKGQGVRDVGKLIGSYPQFLGHPREDNLDLKLTEFREYWGIGITEIEKSPELLGVDRSRVQKVREFLDNIAKLAGDPHFDLNSLSDEQRRTLIQRVSAKQIFESLQQVGAIDSKKPRFYRLSASELNAVTELYEAGKFKELFSHYVQTDGRASQKPREIAAYLSHWRESLPTKSEALIEYLKAEGFAWVERKRILEKLDGNQSLESLKSHMDWLKKQGVTSTEQLTKAMLAVSKISVEDSLEPKVKWLKGQGIRDIGKLLGAYPQALTFSLENLKDKVAWLKKQEFKDIGNLISDFPAVLGYSMEDNLAPKLTELKEHWGLGIADIEKSPMILIASNTRLQGVRLLLDDMARVAGDSRFDFSKVSSQRLSKLIAYVSDEQILEKLKEVKAISSERENLSKLTPTERRLVAGLYREQRFLELLLAREPLNQSNLKKISSYVDDLKKQPLPKEVPARDKSRGDFKKNIQEHLEWLRKQGVKDPEKLMNSFPGVSDYSIKDNLEKKVAWLKSQGIKDIGKFLSLQPAVLSYSIEDNLKKKMAWLRSHGVQDTGKLLNTFPAVLGYSIEDNLEKKVAWLRGQGVEDVGKLIGDFPGVLAYSIEDNLEKKVAWLKRQGVKDIGKVISAFPVVLGYSLEDNLEPKIAWFKNQGVKDTGKLISNFPGVLGYSIEGNLAPKLIELKEHWGVGIVELEKSPMLFGASLSRIESVRQFLDEIAQMAGDSRFNPAGIPDAQRSALILSLSPDHVFQRLKEVGAIRSERKSLSELSPSERSVLVKLYRERELLQQLFSRGLGTAKRQEVSCYINGLLNALGTR